MLFSSPSFSIESTFPPILSFVMIHSALFSFFATEITEFTLMSPNCLSSPTLSKKYVFSAIFPYSSLNEIYCGMLEADSLVPSKHSKFSASILLTK